MKKVGLAHLFLLVFFNSAVSQNLGRVEWHPDGPVVTSTGIARVNPQLPLAVQRSSVVEAAKSAGLRDVFNAIKGFNIDSESTVADKILTKDIIITRIEDILNEFEVGEPSYYADGTVKIKVEVPIYKNTSLMKVLLPMREFGRTSLNVVKSSRRPEVYSGLIINSTGLNLSPALTMQIKDQRGNIVYSPEVIKSDYLFKTGGMVSYVSNMKQAKDMTKRVGNRPLIINAIRTSGKNKTDLVISNEDAEKILSSKENINWLRECRVVVITNNI